MYAWAEQLGSTDGKVVLSAIQHHYGREPQSSPRTHAQDLS